jgi:hypothetical protein
MTLDALTQAYMGRAVDIEIIEERFTHMGKFGKITVYGFSFDTENASIHTEVCVKGGKISGFTPEKEERIDEWGYAPEEAYTEELTDEDCARIARYLDTILAR